VIPTLKVAQCNTEQHRSQMASVLTMIKLVTQWHSFAKKSLVLKPISWSRITLLLEVISLGTDGCTNKRNMEIIKY
jgi:hypothetical protein